MFHPDSATAPARHMAVPCRTGLLSIVAAFVGLILSLTVANPGVADRQVIERGKYLVTLGVCADCDTPGYFFGKPDPARQLGGSEVGFELPGVGVFHGPNLTPDKETGLGTWSEDDIVTAIRTGQRPDGRELAPIMPWRAFANLTTADAKAIAAYLKSLPPVSNKVPGPFGASETPTSFVFKVVSPRNR